MYCDLYLTKLGDFNELIKISHIDQEHISVYSNIWLSIPPTNKKDYIIVLEGNTPWREKPKIIEKDINWLLEEYKKSTRS